jgi:hypothetical protein
MSDRIRYVLALAVGLLAIPGLAFATSGALSSGEPGESTDALAATATSTTTAISAEDLVRACGVEGHYLVDLEATGAIDEIQQAALNALRPICEDTGLPLPAAPPVEGETIVETVTVVRTVPGPVDGASTKSLSTTTTAPSNDQGNASEAMTARERAVAAIDTAMRMRGSVKKIHEAIALIDRGDAAYEAADFDTAEATYEKAGHTAIEAQHELEDDHGGEDHEDDEHEDHEDDEHEDDD